MSGHFFVPNSFLDIIAIKTQVKQNTFAQIPKYNRPVNIESPNFTLPQTHLTNEHKQTWTG